MICIHGTVSGKVQGVFFRDSTRKVASSLNITGWVKNLPDTRVEFVACGEEQNIKKLCHWLAQGPSAAHVAQLDYQEITLEQHHDFTVIR